MHVLCQVWLKVAQWFRRRFLDAVNVFWLAYLFLKKDVTLHLNKPKYPMMLSVKLAKIGLNWPSGFGEDYFKHWQGNFVIIFP